MSNASFCWQCGKALKKRRDGSYVFKELEIAGNKVRVHATCHENIDKEFEHADWVTKQAVRKEFG